MNLSGGASSIGKVVVSREPAGDAEGAESSNQNRVFPPRSRRTFTLVADSVS